MSLVSPERARILRAPRLGECPVRSRSHVTRVVRFRSGGWVAAVARWASSAAGTARARYQALADVGLGSSSSSSLSAGVRAARVELVPLSAPEEAAEGDQFL